MADHRLAVQKVVERALGSTATVERLDRLSGGASRITWAVDVTVDGEQVALVLQQARPGTVGVKPGLPGEAELMAAAAAVGVPVPEVLAAGDGAGTVGAPFALMRRLDGETIPRRILRDDRHAPARSVLVAQAGAALAGVHRIAPDAVQGLESSDQISAFRTLLDSFGEPHPAFELAFRWLEAERDLVEGRRPASVVHGDFRLGNFIVDRGGLVAVLDWELAHLGDPLEDLGWLCVKSWRFGERPPVAGLGAYDELFAAYEGAGGQQVDPAAVRWWEVMGTLKWGVMCMLQARAHLDGLSRSVELATIGRRVCENEHDLLLLLP